MKKNKNIDVSKQVEFDHFKMDAGCNYFVQALNHSY